MLYIDDGVAVQTHLSWFQFLSDLTTEFPHNALNTIQIQYIKLLEFNPWATNVIYIYIWSAYS